MTRPEEILAFWLDEKSPSTWYKQDDALDAEIREKFGSAWENAQEGAYALWLTYPTGALAYIILNDQFSRNMFRGTAQAFASDAAALAAAKSAISKGWDLRIDEPVRQFFYMPLSHSENACDQDRCVRLVCERLTGIKDEQLLHARAHREVIRKYGRFPYRNAALGRTSTKAEQLFLDSGGYASILNALQTAKAA